MEKYKNLLISKEKMNKEILNKNKKYFRYMDNIYIPKKATELDIVDVQSLSELRLKNHHLINYSYTESIINFLVKKLKKRNKILDFGCGNGLSNNIIKRYDNIQEVLGLDVSEYAISQANINYKNNYIYKAEIFNLEDKINKEDCYFDGIISSFVMHFKVYEQQMKELYRVLKKDGLFIYNDYIFEDNEENTIKTENILDKIGFKISTEIIEIEIEGKKKKNKIITAKK